MSEPQAPSPAKLIVGLLYCRPQLQQQCWEALCRRLGPLDWLSEPCEFHYTDYYQREMGPGIMRRTASFQRLVEIEELVEIKLFSNEIEAQLSRSGRRRVNIDPGILGEERLVLATGKNYTHRVYLRRGIYADLTLVYQQGEYRPLPWTYPDYREERLLKSLRALRIKLIYQKRGRLPRKLARMCAE